MAEKFVGTEIKRQKYKTQIVCTFLVVVVAYRSMDISSFIFLFLFFSFSSFFFSYFSLSILFSFSFSFKFLLSRYASEWRASCCKEQQPPSLFVFNSFQSGQTPTHTKTQTLGKSRMSST